MVRQAEQQEFIRQEKCEQRMKEIEREKEEQKETLKREYEVKMQTVKEDCRHEFDRQRAIIERDIKEPLSRQIEWYKSEKERAERELTERHEAELREKMRNYSERGSQLQKQLRLQEEAILSSRRRAEELETKIRNGEGVI